MKAIVFHEYGSPDVLKYEEVIKPFPRDNEVLIQVHAASVNDWDWQLLQGIPFANRLMAGIRRPSRIKILGCDVAGRIESVGRKVKKFRPGDEVFGDISGSGFGAFAEYVCAREDTLTTKPDSLSFEQVAAIPQGGLLALQGLKKGKIQSGQSVVINGASGGTGSFAVQIAKSFGAEVTGVCRTQKMDMVRSLGADYVIDFTQEDFTKTGQRYDLIFDVEAHHSIFDYKRALNSGGHYVAAGGPTGTIMQILFLGSLVSLISSKTMGLLLHQPNVGIGELIELVESGKVGPIMDKCFPLSEAAEAVRYFGEGRKKGKVVITV